MSETPRRLLAAADLHFGLRPEGDECTRLLAQQVCGSQADAFVIAGDVGETDARNLRTCLQMFDAFTGLKLMVPGNHDLWTTSGDTERKYRTILPQVAADSGFAYLDRGPVTAGRTAFIGSIGWYDYSLRNPDLAVSLEDYRRKSLPGVCTWNDKLYIQWEWTDDEFIEICLEALQDQYESVAAEADQVVCVLHHLPFAALSFGPANFALEFCRAYMGSARFGELLLRCPKVRYVICGHRHGPATCEVDGLKAFVAGGGYDVKHLLELDLHTGRHKYASFSPPAS